MLKCWYQFTILLNSRESLLVLPQTPMSQDGHVAGPFVRLFVESKSFSRNALEILSVSWRVGIWKRYNSQIEMFVKFSRERYTDHIQETTEIGVEFLIECVKTGVGYSSVISARSALSNIIKLVCNVYLENHLCYADFSRSFVYILGQLCLDILQLGVLLKFIKSKPTLTDCDLKIVSHR